MLVASQMARWLWLAAILHAPGMRGGSRGVAMVQGCSDGAVV
jgi:hypothetical protein